MRFSLIVWSQEAQKSHFEYNKAQCKVALKMFNMLLNIGALLNFKIIVYQ